MFRNVVDTFIDRIGVRIILI